MNPPEMTPQQRQAASQASIAAGGLPLNAIDRLRDVASKEGTSSHVFTSGLSPNELLLTRKCGLETLGQVMGSTVYQSGWQGGAGASLGGEMKPLTESLIKARHLAMNRLKLEAKMLGATGVVGFRLTKATYAWGEDLIEIATVGTAVREIGARPLSEDAMPFVSSLSGQDNYSLREAGYRPLGVVIGICAWDQIASNETRIAVRGWPLAKESWRNQELSDYTNASYAARALAMDRMQIEARSLKAVGVVGVTLEMETRNTTGQTPLGGFRMTFASMGTCIAPLFGFSETINVRPTVNLSD